MRSLPAESIDLIYLDPPFFSQRNYSIVWGDAREVRSFSDVWREGLPGYLLWLNARLAEAKRLLKKTGSLYLHCDWHAGHYIKVELDKIFGYHNFRNEIIWCYTGPSRANRYFPPQTRFHLLLRQICARHFDAKRQTTQNEIQSAKSAV